MFKYFVEILILHFFPTQIYSTYLNFFNNARKEIRSREKNASDPPTGFERARNLKKIEGKTKGGVAAGSVHRPRRGWKTVP